MGGEELICGRGGRCCCVGGEGGNIRLETWSFEWK